MGKLLCVKLFVFIILDLVIIIVGFNFIPANSNMVTQFKEGPTIVDNNLKAELVLKGEIKFPSSMAFIGPNDFLILEKNEGTVKRFVNGTMLPTPLLDVNVANQGERGLVGIAVKTEPFKNENEILKAKNNSSAHIFLYYTESKEKDGGVPLGNRLYRYEYVDGKLINPRLLLELPFEPGPGHNGGKIVTGSDNNIYVVIGDVEGFNKSSMTMSQNFINGTEPDGRAGILRMTQVGEPVSENGVFGGEFPMNLYFAYGIRNSFGIDFDRVTGKLWDTENGPGFGDEVNLVEPGFNSGWTKVQGIWEYPYGKPYGSIGGVALNPPDDLVDFNGSGKYRSPEFSWKEVVGPTDVTFLNSDKLGRKYENDMFVGDFHNGYLYHFDLNKNRTELSLKGSLKDKVANNMDELNKVIFGKGFGGITDLTVGPDGYLYVLSLQSAGSDCPTDNGSAGKCISYSSGNVGSIFRIVPAFYKR